MGQFADAVKRWGDRSKEKINAVVIGSTQDAVADMLRPEGEGGRMAVKTGFLRASSQVSTKGFPSLNPLAKPPSDAAPNSFEPDGTAMNLEIAVAGAGGTVYIGFTAAYARVENYRKGFVDYAAMNWQETVARNVAKADRL